MPTVVSFKGKTYVYRKRDPESGKHRGSGWYYFRGRLTSNYKRKSYSKVTNPVLLSILFSKMREVR